MCLSSVQHLHSVAGDGNVSINFMLTSTWAVKLGTKIRKDTTSTLLPPTWTCQVVQLRLWFELNLGLCPVDGESQRLCFFIYYLQGQNEHRQHFSWKSNNATSSAKSKSVKIALTIDVPTIPRWTVRSRSQSIGTRNASGATAQPWRTPLLTGNHSDYETHIHQHGHSWLYQCTATWKGQLGLSGGVDLR